MLENINQWFSDYWRFLVLLGIMMIPTILHFSLINAGFDSPFVIRSLAVNTWFKGIIGLGLGIAIGLFLNSKFGE